MKPGQGVWVTPAIDISARAKRWRVWRQRFLNEIGKEPNAERLKLRRFSWED